MRQTLSGNRGAAAIRIVLAPDFLENNSVYVIANELWAVAHKLQMAVIFDWIGSTGPTDLKDFRVELSQLPDDVRANLKLACRAAGFAGHDFWGS